MIRFEFVPHKIQLDRKCVLGEGNSSVVYNGTYEDQNVAVKRIVLNPSINGDGDNCEAQMKLDHENVLKLLAVEEDDDFRYIALELCCGTLFEVIQNTYTGPALPTDREVLYQIAAGLEYIHSQKLDHRDIKPENILISRNGKIKLSDFGLNKQTEGKCYVTGPKGVLLWKAPEQFQADREESEIEIAQKSDVFSCGCVFFVYLTRENGGIHPFGDMVDHIQIYANIQEGNSINLYKANDNDPLEVDHYQLIHQMIQGDSVKRITSADVKNKIEDLLSKCNSTINPLTPQISLCNQGEPASSPQTFTVNYGKHGAESHVKTFSNHDDYEVASCDIVCASTSFPVNSRGSSRFFPTTKNLLSSKASFQHL